MNRQQLEIRAVAAGVDPDGYENDSVLEQKIIYEETNTVDDAAVKATGVLTSDTTAPDADDTVSIGRIFSGDPVVYTFKTALTEARATGTITVTGNFSEDEEVVIGSVTYRFKATTAQAYDINIGTNAAQSLDFLLAAINASGTGDGSDYHTGTLVHPTVRGTTNTDTTQVVQAKTAGTAGNSIVTTTDGAEASWGGATLTGGVAAVANEVLIGASAAAALDNLKLAINAGNRTAYSEEYSTGTTAHPYVEATTNTNTAQTIQALVGGVQYNNITTTEDSDHLSWGGAKVTGGVDTVYTVDEVARAAVSGGANIANDATENRT